jgi:predicted PurR-regulated permease PerM
VATGRAIVPKWAWAALAIAGIGLAIYALRNVLTPIFFAFLIAYFLDPLVDRFEARGVPRALGIVLLLALFFIALALLLLLVVPSVVHEIGTFVRELPQKLERMRNAVEPWLAQHGVAVPHSFEEVRRLVGMDAQGGDAPASLASRATPILGRLAGWVWGGTTSAAAVLGTVFLVPVFAFYLLNDFDRMTAGIRDLVPARYRPFVVDVAREIDEVLGQFVRGQLLVMLILAVLYSLTYWMAGVRLAFPIGIVAGLLSFIPYVGGAAALLLALGMCALSWQGWWQVAAVVAGYGLIQALEGFVITPRIVGDKVGLPAVWVLVALMLGGELFGFLGVLLAVPAAAVAKIFVVRAVAYYRKSRLYTEGGAEGGVLAGVLAEEGLPDAPAVAAEKASALASTANAAAAEASEPVIVREPPAESGSAEASEPAADLEEAIVSALASAQGEPDERGQRHDEKR